MKKYIILLLALCSMSACDYEAVNTNPYGVSDGELGPLKYGARFMNMQQRVIPIGSPSLTTGPGNDLQNTDLITFTRKSFCPGMKYMKSLKIRIPHQNKLYWRLLILSEI